MYELESKTRTYLVSFKTPARFNVRTTASKPPTSSNERSPSGESTNIHNKVSMIAEESVGDGEHEAALLAVEVGWEDWVGVVGVETSVAVLGTCLDSSRRSRNS